MNVAFLDEHSRELLKRDLIAEHVLNIILCDSIIQQDSYVFCRLLHLQIRLNISDCPRDISYIGLHSKVCLDLCLRRLELELPFQLPDGSTLRLDSVADCLKGEFDDILNVLPLILAHEKVLNNRRDVWIVCLLVASLRHRCEVLTSESSMRH